MEFCKHNHSITGRPVGQETKKVGVVLVAGDQPPSELGPAVQELGGYATVQVGCLGGGSLELRDAIERVISSGVDRVLLVPLSPGGRTQAAVEEEVALQKEEHPAIEFVDASTQFDLERHASFLVERLEALQEGQEAEASTRLDLVSTGGKGEVHGLRGGHRFVSRMAALGFVPGAPVDVIQNIGSGPLIVNVRDARIALGRHEARKVRVRVLERGEGLGSGRRGRHRHRRHG
jgi:ferrous iron transport protein A